MTDQPGADQHLDLDALADLLVGEGTDRAVAHVSRCAGCAARLAELDEAQAPVATALAALPAPPLPAGLAERLSAALADAGPLPAVERDGPRPTALPPPDDLSSEPDGHAGSAPVSRTVTPLRRPRRTWLPAAAVAVLALSAAGLAVTALPDGGGGDVASTSAGSAGESAEQQDRATAGLVTNDSGRDYAASPGAFEELLPAVLAGRAAAAPEPAAAEPSPPDVAEESAGTSADSGLMAAGEPLDRLREPAALEGCLDALAPPDGSGQPLAVDYAAYAGQPALVVVLEAADPAKLDVFVVGPDCAPGRDSTRHFTRLDRP